MRVFAVFLLAMNAVCFFLCLAAFAISMDPSVLLCGLVNLVLFIGIGVVEFCE